MAKNHSSPTGQQRFLAGTLANIIQHSQWMIFL